MKNRETKWQTKTPHNHTANTWWIRERNVGLLTHLLDILYMSYDAYRFLKGSTKIHGSLAFGKQCRMQTMFKVKERPIIYLNDCSQWSFLFLLVMTHYVRIILDQWWHSLKSHIDAKLYMRHEKIPEKRKIKLIPVESEQP